MSRYDSKQIDQLHGVVVAIAQIDAGRIRYERRYLRPQLD